jgi:coiled-coil domain-containing protein 115
MAEQLPSPPLIPNAREEEHLLSGQLDALLTQYLILLDTYTTLRADLQKHMSNGFFALAQANRDAGSRLGPGRRYGDEGFDWGMKAQRTVKITERSATRKGSNRERQNQHAEAENQKAESEMEPKSNNQDDNKDATSLPEGAGHATSSVPHSKDMDMQKRNHDFSQSERSFTMHSSDHAKKDPIKWYGILVPPSLRTCQSNFTSAISTSVPDLVNVTTAMRDVEEQIWDVRREMGIISQYNYVRAKMCESEAGDNAQSTHENGTPSKKDLDTKLAGLSLSPPRSTPSTKKPSFLSGSRSEPRSRVLKLD